MANKRWFNRRKKTDPELPYTPPMWLGDWSNGELYHRATPKERLARNLILERGVDLAKYYGMERREFMASGLGMALSMSMINLVNGCSSKEDGGYFPQGSGGSGIAGMPGSAGTTGGLAGAPAAGGGAGSLGSGAAGRTGAAGAGGAPTTPAAGSGTGAAGGGSGVGGTAGGPGTPPPDMTDPVVCELMLDYTDMFIFDIQTHRVARANATYQTFLSILPQGQCGRSLEECFSADEYARKFFLESDTTTTVLSGIPAVDGENPLTNEEIAETRDYVNMLAQETQRVVTHVMVLPNYNHAAQLDGMAKIASEKAPIGAWKAYTPWGPGDGVTGFWMDDPAIGIPYIQRGLEIGIKTFACHKGLPLPGFDNNYGDPKDLGVVAKMFPEATFIAYHSAYQFGNGDETQPYTMGSKDGCNSLVTALLDNGLEPGCNIYGELGTTWNSIQNDPTAATHLLGKLLKFLGEDNIVWGTDCMWYGSPQPQIMTFMSFEMNQQIRMQEGYPELTPEIKRKIMGLNAAPIYNIDPEATRCKVAVSPMAKLKRELDGEFGKYRWAFQKPEITTRRQFFEHLAFHRAAKTPG